MKKYIKPETTITELQLMHMIAASQGGGVQTGSTPGDEYNEEDVTYVRHHRSVWDE